MLHPSGIFSRNLFDDTGSGTATLCDSTREYYSRLSSRGWFLKEPYRTCIKTCPTHKIDKKPLINF